ncbi:unnamed protein product [Timema podura]|uniref:Secreted protein n=1 Tax=Timema podura TaxID=61482 RepID=A0ABN7NQX0_TIMPD|nr:unnamed protein product [Timema podura]
MCGAVLVALTSTWTGMGCCRCKANTAKSVHADEIVPCTLDSERAQRSRQHERGTSAERRYKRSHRRSPTSGRRRHGGHRHGGHTHRHHHQAVAASAAAADHSRRSSYSSQGLCPLPQPRPPAITICSSSNVIRAVEITRLPSLFFTPTLYSSNNKMPEDEWRMGWLIVPHGRGEEGRSYFWKRDSFYFGRFEHFVCREFLTAPLVALVVAGARMVARCRRLST